MSCSGDLHHFTANIPTCDCGRSASALASNLPYPSWTLNPTTHQGTPHSNYAQATDPETNETFLVREYLPDPIPNPEAQRRRFITVAKSLRSSPIASAQILFAYTRNQRCYTVANPPQGTPLIPVRTPESECLTRLQALLTALHHLHTAGAAAGPLFHGDLRPEDILTPNPDPTNEPQLTHALYLENILREAPLPPEHFQQQDLLAAAGLVLTLAQGPGPANDRPARLQRIADPILAATLEFLLAQQGVRPTSAKAALHFLNLLHQARLNHDRQLFQQARTLYPSPRLLRFTTPPPPQPPPPPPRQPVQPPPKPPAPPSYTPVTTQHSPAPAPNPPPARKRRSGCGGCLLTLLLAILVIAAVIAILNRSSPAHTTLDFTAEPNPAPHKTLVELHWTSSGFDRLELDGRPVDPEGSLSILATTSHRYTLAGIRPDGARVLRELDLTVLPRRAAKPSPGTLPPQSSDPATP